MFSHACSSSGPKSREASSAHVGRSSEDTRAAKSARDVADDRPAHWNRLRMAPARTATRKPTNTTRGAAAINPGTAAKPVRPIQIPKPKALPAPTVTPAGAGNGNAPTAVSFKPSWMTTSRSSGAVAMQCNVGSGSTMRTAAALNGELSRPGVVAADSPVIPVAALEDIQDDTLSPVRPFTTPAHGSRGLQFNSGATQMPAGAMDDGPGEAYTRHSLGAQEGRNAGALFLSPERQQSSLRYEYGMDSGERAPGSGMLHRTASTRGGSKARPGSLKAKLLKIQRDGDAAENRIVNVPVDKSSRAVDLQDPRQRAVRYVDAELVAVLEDRAPFKVVRLEVVGRWCKGGVESSANHSEAPVGSALLGYFKPDSCTGQGRGLVVGLRLRVCDGLVVKSGAEHRLLCTGCWEPLADD